MRINKRFYIRAVAIIVVILFAILMAFVGKQHTILLDNKNIEVNGAELKALSIVEIQVDKQPSLELAKRDRDQALVQGQTHTFLVTYNDENWEEIVLEKKVKVPFSEDMLIFSIPAFINDIDDVDSYLQPFEIENVSE
ncbi:MAG: hypothetical protein PQJ49_00445 [Sphaerochaetaceae bacterium]|jgi:hypothetical protein|nr:hypothetical protein [Sphaerochaetaceae bacterium]MDC7236654.1 hypothetical protein [Sphaerochaetaceae bacterium]MDC7248373.1 hypothetical protein [Sphaerochaetaceae bacterium]